MTEPVAVTTQPAGSKLWRPPLVGILTCVLMFVGVGVGHAVMSAIEDGLGHDMTYKVSLLLGFGGIVLLWYGIKSKSESFATWVGFFAGIISTALRYAIPTANILWINTEILSKWGLLTEVWVEPYRYLPEVGLICLAFLIMSALIWYAPKKPSETGERSSGYGENG